MGEILLFEQSLSNIGLISRTSKSGEEQDMVNHYVDYLKHKYRNKKTDIAIFYEPKIETGYPDLVIVEFNSTPPLQWKPIRRNLSASDIKILFYIQSKINTCIDEIVELLGYKSLIVARSISKLANLNLIRVSKNGTSVHNVALQSYCSVKKIISIEAKIDKWSMAIAQAQKNVWFSSESYILMNRSNCNETIIKQCKMFGIGIILLNGKVKTVLPGEFRRFPVSYMSLMFNEWIMRKKNLMEGN